MIDENDDARGILQLSSSTYDTEEPSQDFVTVNREAGTFGTVRIQSSSKHIAKHNAGNECNIEN